MNAEPGEYPTLGRELVYKETSKTFRATVAMVNNRINYLSIKKATFKVKVKLTFLRTFFFIFRARSFRSTLKCC